MKALLAWVVAVVAVTSAMTPVSAQVPTVGIFFDSDFTRMDADCPGIGVADTAYVVANGFNAFLSAIEYMVVYPPSVVWLSDVDIPPVTLGSTPTGITEAWALPLNGYFPVVVARIAFLWNCGACTEEFLDGALVVGPHPYSGFVRATDFPEYNMINAIGMTSLVCPTVPTDDTTWGRVKALYGE